MKSKIVLPKIDKEFLDSLRLPYRIGAGVSGVAYVIICNVEINTKHYKTDGKNLVDICLILPSGYPNSQIDMTHFYPSLRRIDGREIPHTYEHGRFCRAEDLGWQTWSRHRNDIDSWDPKQDCIATHLIYTEAFLKRAVEDLMKKDSASTNVKDTFTRKVEEDILIYPKAFEIIPDKSSGNRLVVNFKR